MLKKSPIPTSTMQKSKNLFDKFGGGNCSENEMRTSTSTKELSRTDYLSSNYVSHTVTNFVSNSAKNVSNYLTPDAKRAFDKLCQAFTKASIFQHFDLEQYIQVETDASGHAIGGVLSQLTNDLSQWHPLIYFSRKMILAET